MKQFFYLTILTVSLLFSSCEETAKTPTSPPSTTTKDAVSTSPPVLPQNDFTSLNTLLTKSKNVNIDGFNKSIIVADDAKEAWVNSPFMIALEYTGDQLESESKKIEIVAPGPETRDQVILTITESGLLDDAIKGSLTILKLLHKDNLWQIEKAGQLWKCWPDRNRNGNGNDFSTEPCS